MTYKIPSDEEVLTAIQRVILKHHTITSQHRIKLLVEDELKKIDGKFRVSGSRIRKLVLRSKYFHLQIDYKVPPKDEVKKEVKTKPKGKKSRRKTPGPKLKACPVCGSKVKKIKNKTLKGGFITTSFKCTGCPYHTGIPVRLPARYVFSIRRL